MILGRDVHLHAACFDEINTAVDQLLASSCDPRRVVFNAHAFPDRVPPDAIVYNFENVDVQVSGSAFVDHEIWDFSERNRRGGAVVGEPSSTCRPAITSAWSGSSPCLGECATLTLSLPAG